MNESRGTSDPMPADLPETVLQFGTGKFLRCFADLLIDEANQTAAPVGRVVVLQSTGADRARTFNRQHGRYRIAVRGLEDGQPVDRCVEVQSVSRALAAAGHWQQVLDLARCESLSAIVSNTTEAGFALAPHEPPTASCPSRSFPAKLLSVLRARWESGGSGLVILPCELLDNNADRLRELVLEQARRWRLPDGLTQWIGSHCCWHNTLVDRIVSAPRPDDPLAADDPLFAVAEPFALWLIEGAPTLAGLVAHPAVRFVSDLLPYSLRKVRILNGAHTALVAKAMPAGFTTVRQAVLDPPTRAWLERLLFDEIVPTLEGRVEDPRQFARETLQRFANPYLEHQLADIALHHEVKLQIRLAPTRDEFRDRFGRDAELLSQLLSS